LSLREANVSKEKKQVRHKAGAYTFYLRPLPKGPLLMALSDADKPQPPLAEVTYAGGVKNVEPNPRDRKYLDALETWEAQYNARLFRLCINRGIERVTDAQGKDVEPSADESEDVRFVYGSALTARAVRQYWLADILGNTAMGFMSLCMGQTEVTEEGLAEAEDRFRPDGEGAGVQREDHGVSPEEPVAGVVPE
jgi:hypothetical protein